MTGIRSENLVFSSPAVLFSAGTYVAGVHPQKTEQHGTLPCTAYSDLRHKWFTAAERGQVRRRNMMGVRLLNVLLLIIAAANRTASMQAAAADSVDFHRDVVPLLRDRCVKCHGPLRREGQLNLSVPTGIARGGQAGPVIVPGRPTESRLWQRVERNGCPDAVLRADRRRSRQ